MIPTDAAIKDISGSKPRASGDDPAQAAAAKDAVK